jgi:nucleotide-binding universal stress UspA family protein
MDSLRSILVHLDGGRHASARLAVARSLAARHEAQLQALCSVQPVPHDLALLHRHRAREHFEHVAVRGAWPMEWLAPTDGQAIDSFVAHAQHADLAVIGPQDAHDEDASTVPRDFAPAVLLGSGTPALLVPHGGRMAQHFDSVLVAWQPGSQSVRALRAALPLLQQATQVHLVSWMDDLDEACKAQQAVVEHLRLHRTAPVQPHRGKPPHDAGATLLALAASLDADLMVMGCYGHSPTRELLLGGATRTVLQSAHLPVLMAA